jgi:WD40 repeat protein
LLQACKALHGKHALFWQVRNGLVSTLDALRCRLHVQVRFWDGEKLEPLKSFTQDYIVESASFCPEKDRFVAGGSSMSVHLYDYQTGTELEYYRGLHPCTRV